jgi:hypothetical protein
MKFTQQAVVNAPVSEVDLERWLFTLSDSEYRATARGHLGAGVFTEDGVRGSINVESIDGTLMVQHYHAVSAQPERVEMLSRRTRGYVFHLVPVHFLVRWTLTATPRTSETTTFACTVETEMSSLVRLAAALIATPWFLRRHVDEETRGFAADINRKLDAGGSHTRPAERGSAIAVPAVAALVRATGQANARTPTPNEVPQPCEGELPSIDQREGDAMAGRLVS